ncbi:MAG: Sulfoquinovose 1-dehydrogenase [Candidatus Omnitrophica bacterium]|nr:Sulfoquinovose 1-dehydrogenase [Candidatus Omnitrophota bacterium]
MAAVTRIALVSGANKGLGLEISRQLAAKGLTVLLTARDAKKGEAATAELRREGHSVDFYPMDVTDTGSIKRCYDYAVRKHRRVDVLINNAGIMLEEDKAGPALSASVETVRRTFETNVIGHLVVCQIFIPLMEMHGYGRIVNLSSGLGTLSEMEGGFLGYRLSKTALNALTRVLAHETKGMGILVNSMCPGWCRTDMGGPEATRSAEEGARTAVYLATLGPKGPTGKYFRDKKQIDW